MVRRLALRLALAVLTVGGCALAAGCLSGSPTYFPYLLPGGPAVRTHAKPLGPGFFADFDPHAHRIEVRPEAVTAPVRGTQVLIATVYDRDGRPRRKRRVEWIVEGPGTIVEVDESGWLPGRGMKIDNKYAYSHTDYFEHVITRGNDDPNDDFAIGPGQTWCAITSAVEGQTTVIAYAPEIADWDHNKVYVRLNWIDGTLRFPPPANARAGGDYTFTTKITKAGESAAGYRIRYRILDGPAAALSTGSASVGSVTEAVTAIGEDGLARVRIAQPMAAAGANRIAIEVIKPNPDAPGQFTLVSKGETKITWEAPQLAVRVEAPRAAPLDRDVTVTYAIVSAGSINTPAVTLNATVPEGLELVSAEPRAIQDGRTLIWTVPGVPAGKQESVTAIYRPLRLGPVNLTADARTADGLSARGVQPLQIAEAKLLLRVEGPETGVVGESLAFRATVTNEGGSPAEQVRIRARLDDGLEAPNKTDVVEQSIPLLASGETRTIALPISAKRGGTFGVQTSASADGNLIALPQASSVRIKDAQLSVTAHGPGRAYVGQEAKWEFVVRNTGDVALGEVSVRVNLPPEVRFVSATDGGQLANKQIVWNLGSAPARQEKTISLVAVPERLSQRAVIGASVAGQPTASEDGAIRTVSLVKPFAGTPTELPVEIIGIPALQISVKDADDPVGVGQQTTYTIRVRNSGSLTAGDVVISAEIPAQLRAIRATGPGKAGTIEGARVTFPKLDSLAAGAEATFVVAVEGLAPGDARFRAEVKSMTLRQPLRAEESTRVQARTTPSDNSPRP